MKNNFASRTITVLLLYCLLFGPLAAILSLLGPWIPIQMNAIFEFFFFPHFVLAYYSPFYWQYFTFWLKLGGLKAVSDTHSNYKEYFHHVYYWW